MTDPNSAAKIEPLHFQFESDFVESWNCIPMRVRLYLDTCGVKLKLVHWTALAEAERQQLVEMSCETEAEAEVYRDRLMELVRDRYGSEPSLLPIPESPAWDNLDVVPETVAAKAQELELAIAPQQWSNLTRLQRFALIKLSRPSHENRNFLPALQEFGLA
nr:nitrate reductase associated protein [Synechococcus sp. PCC 7336]